MLWSEFVAGLDKIRAEIRSSRGLKAPAVLSESDPIIKELYQLLNSKNIVEPELPPEDLPVLHTPEAKIVNIVERGEGEGRMVVMGRPTPFVPKKPVLEEIFDEKELGK